LERQLGCKQLLVSNLCSCCDFNSHTRCLWFWQESVTQLNSLVLVSLGGVAGTLTRYGIGAIFPDDRQGTLIANVTGVALASALLVLMERRGISQLRLLLLPGFCAGFTTFSAVTANALEPIDGGMLFLAQNVIFSLIAVIVVLPLARKVIPVRS
jgi:fluoride exporter